MIFQLVPFSSVASLLASVARAVVINQIELRVHFNIENKWKGALLAVTGNEVRMIRA